MPAIPPASQQQKMVLRGAAKVENITNNQYLQKSPGGAPPPQNKSVCSKKPAKDAFSSSPNGKGGIRKPKPIPTTTGTQTPTKDTQPEVTRFVCSVCKNSISIRDALQNTEVNNFITKIDELKCLNEAIAERTSHIETLDLHIQHLLLHPKSLQNHHDQMVRLEQKMDSITASIGLMSVGESDSKPSAELSHQDLAGIEKLISDQVTNCNSNISNIENKLDSLQSSLRSLQSPLTSEHTEPKPLESAISSSVNNKKLSDIENPIVSPVVDYKPEFIDDDCCNKLLEFLQNDAEFTKLKGRSVTSYGEPYPYPGSPPAKCTPIPPIVDEIIKKIEDQFPESNLTSCLITEFAGTASNIPEHSDDEAIISPESNIFTLTIGSQRTVTFRDLCSGAEKSIQPEHLSLYVMSRASQNLWKHRINPIKEDDATLRYSFTFRSVCSKNKSSTIILGDSNTKHIKFGEDRGSLGKKLPGRREPVYHIGQIDPTICLGYQNILVHVAINDMKNSSPGRQSGDPAPSDTDSHVKRLAEKLECIQILCPNASLTVSPALPTKINSLNRRAMSFNVKLVEYVKLNNPSIVVLDFESFAPNGHDLSDEYCCYKNKNDKIHLGMLGIRKLANIFIESLTLPRNFVDERRYSDVVSGESGQTPIKSDHE